MPPGCVLPRQVIDGFTPELTAAGMPEMRLMLCIGGVALGEQTEGEEGCYC